MRIFHTNEQYCPNCNHQLDAMTNPTNNQAPKKGDITICAYCQHVLRFVSDTVIHSMSPEEISELPIETRNGLKTIINRLKQVKMNTNTNSVKDTLKEINNLKANDSEAKNESTKPRLDDDIENFVESNDSSESEDNILLPKDKLENVMNEVTDLLYKLAESLPDSEHKTELLKNIEEAKFETREVRKAAIAYANDFAKRKFSDEMGKDQVLAGKSLIADSFAGGALWLLRKWKEEGKLKD